MRPLRDDAGGAETAARLVRAAHGPLPPGAKERVRRALERRPARRAVPGPLVLLLFMVGTAAAASAVIGGVALIKAKRARPDVGAVTAPVAPRAAGGPTRAATPVAATPEVAVTPAKPAPVAPLRADKAQAAHAPLHATVRVKAALVDDDADAELVSTAMLALRREHAPARALELLSQYLARHYNGALVEEALALSIDAATQLGDGRAAPLAANYLRRFPDGRFAANARAVAAQR